MDFLKDNRYKTVLDTTLFKYIPIFHSSLQMSYTIEKKKISPLISEVLVYEKKEKKIIGSVLTDKNNKYIVSFCKYKNYVGRMPIRPENRLTYIPQKQYGKIEKFISHNHKKGYFFTIEDIGGVFFMLENNKIITICSPDI
jgi:protease II